MFATANRHEASKFNNLFICHVDLMPVAAAFQRYVNWRSLIMYKLRLSLRGGTCVGKHRWMDEQIEGQN